MTLKDTNTNALLEKSFECGSGAGMKHIGFYLDGQNLMVRGSKVGMTYTPEAGLRLTASGNGNLETVVNMEIGENK